MVWLGNTLFKTFEMYGWSRYSICFSHVQTLQNDIKWPFMVTLVTRASLALAKFRFHRNTKKIVGSKIIGSMGDDRFSTVKAQFTLISCKVAGERWSRDFVDQKPPLVLGLVGPG